MDNKISNSLLDSINLSLPERDKFQITESRGSHVISSSINFIQMIKENYSEEDANELIKRFINAVRTNDPRKFYRGLSHLKNK